MSEEEIAKGKELLAEIDKFYNHDYREVYNYALDMAEILLKAKDYLTDIIYNE